MPQSYHSTPAVSPSAAVRRGDEDAVHAAVDGDERAAVVHRRDLRVGLDRLAPDAVGRADDAGATSTAGDRRSVSSVRPSASAHWPTSTSFFGNAVRHRQVLGVHLQEREHPRLVGGDHLRDEPRRAAGDGDEDVRRLVGEVERAGDDVPVRRRRSGRWSARCPCGRPAPARPAAPFFGPSVTSSAPPAVSIFTTVGATFADAAFMAFSVASFTSGFGCAGRGDHERPPRRGRSTGAGWKASSVKSV